MGSSWQRCAAGQWSIVVDTAKGTKCTPEGIVDDISTEHSDSDDDDDDGNGNGSGTSGASRAIEGRGRWLLSAASCGIVVAVLLHV